MTAAPTPERAVDPVRAPRPAPVLSLISPSRPLDDDLTWVELIDDAGRTERWIRFGAIAAERPVTRRNRFVGFAPGAVFASVRWAANARGTAAARLDIAQAVARGAARTALPGVTPGALSLLQLVGWARVRQALAVIDAIAATGAALEAVAPEHWRHVQARMTAGLDPEPYRAARRRGLRLRPAPGAPLDSGDAR